MLGLKLNDVSKRGPWKAWQDLFKLICIIDVLRISHEITPRWMPQNLIDVAWCRQGTSHYLNTKKVNSDLCRHMATLGRNDLMLRSTPRIKILRYGSGRCLFEREWFLQYVPFDMRLVLLHSLGIGYVIMLGGFYWIINRILHGWFNGIGGMTSQQCMWSNLDGYG